MSGYSYIYDAEGNRVSKQGSAAVDHIFLGGRELARLAGGQWTDLIYGANGLLAEVPGTQAGAPVYRMVDHLGTAVGTLDANGTLLSTSDYEPFGALFAGGSTDPYQFNGKERDAESGNDYFGARYYASSMGRWLSPDWSAKAEPVPYAKLDNPQSLNLYAYVGNNPMTRVDADGHVQRDKNGNVIFTPTGDKQQRGLSYQYTGADGKKYTVTASWQVQPGYVKADNGDHIQAEKPTSSIQASTTDSSGKVVHSGIEGTPGLENVHSNGNSADCHGTTFASGQVWINNDQVPALLKGDGFVQTSNPHPWDVGVYSGSNGVDHSVRALAPDQTVLSKGGITDMTITTPANGWYNHSDTLTYYPQHPDE